MLLLAIFFSFSTVWLNDIAMSWGRIGMQRIILDSIERSCVQPVKNPEKRLSQKAYLLRFVMFQEHRLIAPTLIFRGSSSQDAVTVTADEAELNTNPLEGTLTLKLLRPAGLRSDFHYLSPNEESYVISLDDFLSRKENVV